MRKMNKILKVPDHVGIILDGNGRWAKKRHMPRLFGHLKGVEAIKKTLIAGKKLGIKVISVYAFSTENWKRSDEEINGIFKILEDSIDKYQDDFIKYNYKLLTMGDLTKLSKNLQEKIINLKQKTKNNSGLIFNVALNYGGRSEIVNAVNSIINNKLTSINEITFEKFLYSYDLPPLDFVIRTSGEQRISNFMLWQIAYSELYFPKYYWPTFNEKKLIKCIKEYNKRNRRFGNVTQ